MIFRIKEIQKVSEFVHGTIKKTIQKMKAKILRIINNFFIQFYIFECVILYKHVSVVTLSLPCARATTDQPKIQEIFDLYKSTSKSRTWYTQ